MTEDPFAPQPAAQRREARERAIELLYEAELRAAPAAEILEEQLVALDPFVIELVLGVTSNVEELDAEIGSLLKKEWSLDRLGMLDLWILRLGVHELLRHDAPVAVVINEAVELGNRFGATEDSGRFINGVLGAAARRFELGNSLRFLGDGIGARARLGCMPDRELSPVRLKRTGRNRSGRPRAPNDAPLRGRFLCSNYRSRCGTS